MDDNFSNFPEIIVQKLNSIFFKIPILLLTKGQQFFCKLVMKIETEVCSYW